MTFILFTQRSLASYTFRKDNLIGKAFLFEGILWRPTMFLNFLNSIVVYTTT